MRSEVLVLEKTKEVCINKMKSQQPIKQGSNTHLERGNLKKKTKMQF